MIKKVQAYEEIKIYFSEDFLTFSLNNFEFQPLGLNRFPQRYSLNPWSKGNTHNSEQKPLPCWKCPWALVIPALFFVDTFCTRRGYPPLNAKEWMLPFPSSFLYSLCAFPLSPPTHHSQNLNSCVQSLIYGISVAIEKFQKPSNISW